MRFALSAALFAQRSADDTSSESGIADVLGGVSARVTLKPRWGELQRMGNGAEAPLPLHVSSWLCDGGVRSCAAEAAVQVPRMHAIQMLSSPKHGHL
jgi:hypothetical protein